MSKVIKTKVFSYDELSEKAKEQARQWWLEGAFDHDWWDSTYDDAENVGLVIGSFDTYRGDIEIDFVSCAEDAANAIVSEHGESCDTYKVAKAYLDHLKLVRASEDHDPDDEMDHNSDFRRAIGEEYLSLLKKEMEYMESDEYVEETIRANEYTFTADGRRFG